MATQPRARRGVLHAVPLLLATIVATIAPVSLSRAARAEPAKPPSAAPSPSDASTASPPASPAPPGSAMAAPPSAANPPAPPPQPAAPPPPAQAPTATPPPGEPQNVSPPPAPAPPLTLAPAPAAPPPLELDRPASQTPVERPLPFYRKEWFWGTVGLVVLTTAIILVASASTGPSPPATTLGNMHAF